jgi:hypothetical protein
MMLTVYQAPGCPVPFGKHEHAFGRQRVDHLGELGSIFHGLTRDLFAIDLLAAASAQRGDLAIEILIERAHLRIVDFEHFPLVHFATISDPPRI